MEECIDIFLESMFLLAFAKFNAITPFPLKLLCFIFCLAYLMEDDQSIFQGSFKILMGVNYSSS